MQKRGIIFPSNKAQITIFMILGIIILFIFLFLITLNVRVATHALEESQEEIFSKVFRKEALRIFVEDCLRDELRSALRLIGKQGGRIWDDQEGGTEQFSPGVWGIFDVSSGDRVAYGLTRKEYLVEEHERGNPYPCNEPFGKSPVFCKYMYPASEVRFGVIQPWESKIEKDLENYLEIKAQSCIEGYLNEKVSGAKLSPEEYTLDVDLQDDGIAVQAFYPLRFGLDGKNYFTLSTFDFLYPSSLRRFLRAVYIQPLLLDWQYVDFPYVDGTLHQASFQANKNTINTITRTTFKTDYERLGIILESGRGEPTGDTLFTATAPFPNIVDTPGEYVFTFARQNRPPALDYVGRNSCAVGDVDKQYDYLVVKGADGELGEIDIRLNAKDPDEEKNSADEGTEEDLGYFFSGTDGTDIGVFQRHLIKEDGNLASSPTPEGIEARRLLMQKPSVGDDPVLGLQNKIYKIVVKVKDKWVEGQEDSQEVRILVDNAINPEEATVEVRLPWGDAEKNADGKIIISKEDPFIVEVSPPIGTSATGSIQEVKLNNQIITLTSSTTTLSSCQDFSKNEGKCDFSNYGAADLETGITISQLSSVLGTTNLVTTFSVDYCPDTSGDATSTDTKVLEVKGCVPYVNEENEYPYIPGTDFYKYKFQTDGKIIMRRGTTDPDLNEEISPFAATHFSDVACCNNDGTIKTSIVPNCQGPQNCAAKPQGFTSPSFQTGYIVVEHKGTCERGNVCEGTPELFSGELVCGNYETQIGCLNSIPEKCRGNNAWDYVNTDSGIVKEGFCYGTMGCAQYCDFSEGNNMFVKNAVNNDYAKNQKKTELTTRNPSPVIEFKCQQRCPDNQFKKDIDKDGFFGESGEDCP